MVEQRQVHLCSMHVIIIFFIIEKFVLHDFQRFRTNGYIEGDALTVLFGNVVLANKVTWCQDIEDNQWDASGSALLYGNDASLGVCYQVASILIVIPKYTTKRLSAGTNTDDLCDCSVNNALEFPKG